MERLEVDAGLQRTDQERDLGRIATETAAIRSLSVVARRAGQQRQVLALVRGAPFRHELSGGLVRRAGHLEHIAAPGEATEAHPAFSDGAGLIRADEIRGADDLNHRERPHESSALEHASRSERQGQRQHHRQSFRDGGDRECHGRDEGFERFTPTHRQLKHSDDRDQYQDDAGDTSSELAHLALERRGTVFSRLHGLRDAADLRAHPGGGHHETAAAARYRRAHVEHVAPFRERSFERQRVGCLGHGEALAGERCLVDVQVMRTDQPSIRRDPGRLPRP